jgi:hypothetical protein
MSAVASGDDSFHPLGAVTLKSAYAGHANNTTANTIKRFSTKTR